MPISRAAAFHFETMGIISAINLLDEKTLTHSILARFALEDTVTREWQPLFDEQFKQAFENIRDLVPRAEFVSIKENAAACAMNFLLGWLVSVHEEELPGPLQERFIEALNICRRKALQGVMLSK